MLKTLTYQNLFYKFFNLIKIAPVPPSFELASVIEKTQLFNSLLLLINSGLFYRYASKLVIRYKPKNIIPFLKVRYANLILSKNSIYYVTNFLISLWIVYLGKDLVCL